jgi:nicotinic acetylcholine receptor
MLLIAESMPATSEMVPLIEIYLTIVMALTSLSIVLTVYVLQLHHSGPVVIPIPYLFKYALVRYIAPIVGMKKIVQIYAEEHHLIETDEVYRCFAKPKTKPMDRPLVDNNQKFIQEKKIIKYRQGIYTISTEIFLHTTRSNLVYIGVFLLFSSLDYVAHNVYL